MVAVKTKVIDTNACNRFNTMTNYVPIDLHVIKCQL